MKPANYNHKRCMVTGGAGFIGSHLCEHLLKNGYTVFCIDNLLTGKLINIAPLRANQRFFFHQLDISKQNDLPEIDYIFHLASPASPKWYQRYPLETLLVNTYGTHLLLQHAQKVKAKFLFASSSEVYGEPLEHPQKENYRGNVSTVGPRACYDEAKRCGEAIVATAEKVLEVDTRIVRIFNTYGPRMQKDDGRVISNFVSQTLTKQSLNIYGDGSQTRSFCFISDLIEGLMLAMFSPNTRGSVVNLGNDEEISINELISTLQRIVQLPLSISYQPLPQDDPSRRCPDISKAKRLLGWAPRISLEEGLKRCLEAHSEII